MEMNRIGRNEKEIEERQGKANSPYSATVYLYLPYWYTIAAILTDLEIIIENDV